MPANVSGGNRLQSVFAIIQLLLGLAIHQFPHEFRTPAYAPVQPLLPYFSAALMAAGVSLLQWRPVRLPPAYRIIATLAAAPLGVMAYVSTAAGGWPGAALYGSATIALALAPWLPERAGAASRGPDLLAMTATVAFALGGGVMIARPDQFEKWLYEPIAGFVPLVGVSALVGAALMVWPRRKATGRSGSYRELVGAIFPAIIAYDCAMVGLWSGVMLWGVLAAALLIGGFREGPIAVKLSRRPCKDDSLSHIERTLEWWTWALVVVVVVLMAIADEAAFTYPRAASWLVLAMTGYNLLMYRLLASLGRSEVRIVHHVVFLAISASGLHLAGGPSALGFLMLLVVLPPLATTVLGVKAGYRLLLLIVALVVVTEAVIWTSNGYEPLLIGRTGAKVVLLVTATVFGIRNSVVFRKKRQELAQAMEALKQGESHRNRLVQILEATPDYVGIADKDGWIQYVNRAGREMTGLPLTGDIEGFRIGRSHTDWATQRVLNEALPTAARDGVWRGDSVLVTPDGREIPVVQTIIAHRTEDGDIDFYSSIMRDVTEQKRLEAQLTHLAEHDHLTQLSNRRHFQHELARTVADHSESGLAGALIVFDLDAFKYVNDTLGHRAGDDLLSRIAALLRDEVGPEMLVGRLGGDEFAVLVRDASAGDAERIARRLLRSIHDYRMMLNGHPVSVTASAGIACFPLHGTTAEDLLAHADLALYQAKDRGRDSCTMFAPDAGWQEHATTRRTWDARIRRALAHDQFVLACQPIWNVQSARPEQFELLLRMVDEDGVIIPPAAFIPVAEDLGLIHAIDRWVVKRGIELLQTQHQAGRDITLSLNLSGRAFSDPELLTLIEDTLQRTGVDPAALVLEITETAAIADVNLARRMIEPLSELGCRFALDDFGSGFSSFNMLKRLQFHYLKIDRSFVASGLGSAADREFVRAMVNIAHGLGQKVMAEGVEDEATLKWLGELGVDYAQGFFLGRPRPVAEADWIEAAARRRVEACLVGLAR